MNISSDKPYMVFAKEYNGKPYYKIGLSRKNQNGQYENGYIDIHFRNNIKIENKTQIYLRNAFLTFYLSKDNHTIPYIQVMEFETVGETIEQSKPSDIEKKDGTDLFKEFGKEHADDDLELPF